MEKLLAAGALVAVAVVPGALAQVPGFTMGWTVGDDETVAFDWTRFGDLNGYGDWQVPDADGTWTGWSYSGDLVGGGGGAWALSWDAVFSGATGVNGAAEAFITANIVVTNNHIVNQNFSLLMTLPTGSLGNVTERGSIVGTVSDLTFDDATVFAPAGDRIYTPMIDGSPEAPGFLMKDPFNESAGGPMFITVIDTQDFGIPVPVDASQDIDSSIGILLNFDLTPGDAVSFTSVYEVLLPAPAGLPLLAALGLVGVRRRPPGCC